MGARAGRAPALETTCLLAVSHLLAVDLSILATLSGYFRTELMVALMQYIASSLVGVLWEILSFRSLNFCVRTFFCWLHLHPCWYQTPRYLTALPRSTLAVFAFLRACCHADTFSIAWAALSWAGP